MPREIINAVDVLSPVDIKGENCPEYQSQAVLAWGWKPGNGHCAALLDVNHRINGEWRGASVALEWGDLERLNRSVRRAMKHYRKETETAPPQPLCEVSEEFADQILGR